MTSVNGVQKSGSNGLGKADFLNLLTKQLQFQDPLKPMGSTEFIAQLAQFRALEAGLETNKALESLLQENRTMNNMGATSLLGRRVEVAGGSISHKIDPSNGSNAENISYSLDNDASDVVIQVKNEAGETIKTITENGRRTQGTHQMTWDGTDRDGNAVSDGTYYYQGTARDQNGNVAAITTYAEGDVTGISYEDGGPFARINGMNVKVGDIVKILR